MNKDDLQKEYQRIENALDNLFQDNVSEYNIDTFIEHVKLLEKYSFNKKRAFLIWNHQKYMPSYISNSCTEYGYTPEEIYKMSLFEGIKHLYWKQIPGLFRLVNMSRHQFVKNMNEIPKKNREAFICGVRLQDKWNNWLTFFVKSKTLKTDKNGVETMSLLTVETINHLLKGNPFWLRVIGNSKDRSLKYTVFLNHNRQTSYELLSERQIEILQLSIQNKDIETIGKLLNISPATVKKHRKNMLARVGAKDMSALIYLCEQCKLI